MPTDNYDVCSFLARTDYSQSTLRESGVFDTEEESRVSRMDVLDYIRMESCRDTENLEANAIPYIFEPYLNFEVLRSR